LLFSIKTAQVWIDRELVDDVWHLSRRINKIKRKVEAVVEDRYPGLLAIPSCAALMAAKLFGEIAGIERFSSEAKLAIHARLAPRGLLRQPPTPSP
jgi:transposase